MNQNTPSTTVKDLTQALVNDLQKEEISIEILEKHLDGQLAALRSQERSSLEELTLQTSNEVNNLHILQNSKLEHIRLLSEQLTPDATNASLDTIIAAMEQSFDDALVVSLKQLHARIPERAVAVREKSKELAYSLQYALHLGHQMIEAIQGATSSPPMLIYTAAGSKKISASKRMMVNKVG